MRSINTLSTLLVAIALASCGGAAAGDLGSCATSYSGTFEGDVTGVISARVVVDGTFLSQWQAEDGTILDWMGTVSEEGAIEVDSLEGNFDFDTCTASGTWTMDDGSTGTFRITDPTL